MAEIILSAKGIYSKSLFDVFSSWFGKDVELNIYNDGKVELKLLGTEADNETTMILDTSKIKYIEDLVGSVLIRMDDATHVLSFTGRTDVKKSVLFGGMYNWSVFAKNAGSGIATTKALFDYFESKGIKVRRVRSIKSGLVVIACFIVLAILFLIVTAIIA